MRQGFTLIEISIVLIIIGLVSAAILVGKDMVYLAEVRAQASQVEQYNTAAFAFRSKFDCIPGDCNKAVSLGLGTAGNAGDNGNGDGRFQRDVWSTHGQEIINFWYHLKTAGLITDNVLGYRGALDYKPGVDTPQLKMQSDNRVPPENPHDGNVSYNPHGGLWVLSISSDEEMSYVNALFRDLALGKSIWLLTNNAGYIENRHGIYHAWRAYSLDQKLDDGKPESGLMRARPYKLYSPTLYLDEWKCVVENVNEYYMKQSDFHGNSSGCVVMIQTAF